MILSVQVFDEKAKQKALMAVSGLQGIEFFKLSCNSTMNSLIGKSRFLGNNTQIVKLRMSN